MKKLLLTVSIFSLSGFTKAQDVCLTQLEKEVYDLITKHRMEKGLSWVGLSKTLMITANRNVEELSKGNYVVLKPEEFGDYKANTGMIRYSTSSTKAEWISSGLTQPSSYSDYHKIIENLDAYAANVWQVMGICIRNTGKDPAPMAICIVFGDKADVSINNSIANCETESYFKVKAVEKKPAHPIVKFRVPDYTDVKVYMTFTNQAGKREALPATIFQQAYSEFEKGKIASLYLEAPNPEFYEVFISEKDDPIVPQEDVVVKVMPTQLDTIWQTVSFKGNSLDEVKAYLTNGGKLEAVDDRGWTMLHRAVFRDNVEVVQYLLEKGANVNAFTTYKEVPMSFVKSERMFDLLLSKKPNMKVVNTDKYELLHHFSDKGLLKAVKYMVEIEKVNVNAANRENATPLNEAISKGRLDVVKYLLEHGAKCVKSWGNYPIYDAVKNNDLEMAKVLLTSEEGKKQLNLINGDDGYPLHYAVWQGNYDLVKVLVENGASLTLKVKSEYNGFDGKSILQICDDIKDAEMKEAIRSYLISKGAK